MSFAVVTDSTSSLPAQICAEQGISVVPLQVIIGANSFNEDEVTPSELAQALQNWEPVSTSRPAPAEFLAAYQAAAEAGATEVVSVHLSAQISATYESATLAAADSPIPVTVVDSQQVGMGLGYAVLAARAAASAEEAARAASRVAAETRSLFYVDTLEYLRRGGRIGAAAALLGSALAVKPILRIQDGRVTPFERVRTSAKALARLEELALEGNTEPVQISVAHLANFEKAENLAAKLTERAGDRLVGEVGVGELGAVLGTHVGPGMVAVMVSPVSTATSK